MKKDISTIIVAKDSPTHLFETIQSAQLLSKEIIIVDIGLDEIMRSKLQSEDVIVQSLSEPVPYVERIREKIKSFAKYEYVLFLDPDEVLSTDLIKKVSDLYKNVDYVSIPRKNILFGKWIQHAKWWPDYQVRLFKKHAVTWSKKLHAQPQTSGKELRIEEDERQAIIHYNYSSIDEYFLKMVRYAKSEAEYLVKQNESFSLHIALTKGISEFISRFFAHDGYKEGMYGFVLSFIQMMYYPLVSFYVWELNKYESEDDVVQESRFFFSQGLYETFHWLKRKQLLSSQKLKSFIVSFFLKK